MAEKDEILVKYKADISQYIAQLDALDKKLGEAEKANEGLNKRLKELEDLLKKGGGGLPELGDKAQRAAGKFNALNNSINQLSRELPAFAVNANTGLLAISNNIPALADGISNIIAKNKQLAAEGKQTVSVIKQLGAALFSWQTALSVGVTLLTLYGGKLVDVVMGTKELEQAQKNLTKSTELSNKAFEIEERRLRAIGVAEAEIVAKRRERIKQNISIADEELRKQQEILETTLGNLLKAKAAAAIAGPITGGILGLIAPSEQDIKDATFRVEEVRLKREELTVQLVELNKKETETIAKENDKRAKEREKELNELDKIQARKDKHSADERKRLQDEADFEKKILEQRAENAEKLQQATLKGLDERQAAAQKQEIKRLSELSQNKALSYQQQYDILVEQLEKGFITQQAFANAEAELNNQRTQQVIMGVQAVSNAIVGFAALAGQNTQESKDLASVAAIIDSIASAQMAYKAVVSATYLGPSAPVLATVAAAGALAQGFARVQQIQSVTVPQSKLEKPNYQSAAASYNTATTGRPMATRAFKDGVVDLDGPGTWTSDSIPAYLSRGESVIPSYQTYKKKDELIALNKSVIDYEKLLQKKYIDPAVKQKEREFTQNITSTLDFSDKRIVKAIEKNRPATSKDILALASEIAKKNRQDSFERKLKGNGR